MTFGGGQRTRLRLLPWVVVAVMGMVPVAITTAAADGAPRAAPAAGRSDTDKPELPPGFDLQDTATGQGAYNLTDFGFLPDGSALTIGKNGLVTWVPPDGAPTTIRKFEPETAGDLGLVGIGIAPDYARTHHVYLIRSIRSATAPPYLVRLSRFTVRGGSRPTGLVGEKVLLRLTAAEHTHAMTTVLPAADGTLWVSIGDLRTYRRMVRGAVGALIVGRPAGKLLHITATGAGVRSNPYYRASRPFTWRSRTYASGFRSPFRLSLDPRTGLPVVGDVGWSHWEEVDVVRRGASYGWPCWEGPTPTYRYTKLAACAGVANTSPVWTYAHGTGSTEGNSVTGGVVYTGTDYPTRYRGAYFFGDYVGCKIWTMRLRASGTLARPPEDPPFGTDIGAPVRFGAAPNGDIVYADLASGDLRRLTY